MSLAGRPPSRLSLVLLVLFAVGWGANHFASAIPVLARRTGFDQAVLDGAFGVYAVGLLPGLLGGGAFSDRLGRRPVMVTGAVIAALGNLVIAGWPEVTGIFLGRLVVGVGTGLAVSAGTAWSGDLGGRRGAPLAGTLLTCGFAAGPLVTGLLATVLTGSATLPVPFVVASALTVIATVALAVATRSPGDAAAGERGSAARVGGTGQPAPAGPVRSNGRALAAAIPMALWVFSTATISLLVLSARLGGGGERPWLPGVAAVLTLGSGVLVQLAARRVGWGPRAGVVGAGLATLGFVGSALAGDHPSPLVFVVCSVVLGCAYGLCLRDGLVDVETLTPVRSRGLVTGVFYAATYLGFGVPVLLEVLRPVVGVAPPLLVLAALALLAALWRTTQVRAGRLR